MLKDPNCIWADNINRLDSNRLSALYLLLIYDRGINKDKFTEKYSLYNRKRAILNNYKISEESPNQILKSMIGMYIDIDNKMIRYINPGLKDFMNKKMNEDFNEEDYCILLESIYTLETVTYILAKTDINRKLCNWNIFSQKFNEILLYSLNNISKEKIEKLRWIIQLLITDRNDVLRINISIERKFPENTQKTFEIILLNIIEMIRTEKNDDILLSTLSILKYGYESNIFPKNSKEEVLTKFFNSIIQKIYQYSNENVIYIYCKFCSTFSFKYNEDDNTKIKQLIIARKDDGRYNIFTVYDNNAINKIIEIGNHFNLDIEDTIIAFKEALEDFRSIIEECRDDYDEYVDTDDELENIFINSMNYD